jgi:hypothetical protein
MYAAWAALALLISFFECRRFRRIIRFRSFHGFVLFCRNPAFDLDRLIGNELSRFI